MFRPFAGSLLYKRTKEVHKYPGGTALYKYFMYANILTFNSYVFTSHGKILWSHCVFYLEYVAVYVCVLYL
jgi:hypothetical protein